MDSYRITSDIDRIETSVTLAGRRIGVRAALIALVGILLSIGLVSLLAPSLGSPLLFMPIGLLPLYVAALLAFVCFGDGRALEAQILDRVRFSRRKNLLVNLGRAAMETGNQVLDLTKEVFIVSDVRNGKEIKADLSELDLPFTIRARSD